MDSNREKLLNFVKTNGPLLPVQVSKYLNTDIIFAGAMLSELVAHNHVFVTNTKRGGSPFYYTKGQESKLSQLGVYLSGKEKEAFELIFSAFPMKYLLYDMYFLGLSNSLQYGTFRKLHSIFFHLLA